MFFGDENLNRATQLRLFLSGKKRIVRDIVVKKFHPLLGKRMGEDFFSSFVVDPKYQRFQPSKESGRPPNENSQPGEKPRQQEKRGQEESGNQKKNNYGSLDLRVHDAVGGRGVSRPR